MFTANTEFLKAGQVHPDSGHKGTAGKAGRDIRH